MTTSFEDVLAKLESGPWNWLIFLLCSLWGLFGGMQTVATAFLSPVTDHWCHIPELHVANWTKEQIWNYSLPRTTLGGEPHHAQCEMYVRNYSLVTKLTWEEAFLAAPEGEGEGGLQRRPCTSWDYDTEVFQTTLISEWDLVCGKEGLKSLIQSIFMVGVFFGAPLGGYFADRYGRKKLMTGSLWVFILVSITGSFSPYYQLFLLCRFLMAFTGNIVYQTSYIIAVESCTARQRAVVGILFSVPFALGVMALPVVAFHVRQWHLLHLAMSVPVIVLIVNTILLPESPRWLVLTGRWSEAEKELQRAARWNGRKPFDSSWLLATLKEMQTEEKIPKEEQHEPDAPPSSSSSSFSSRVKGALRSSLVFMRTPMLRRISLVMYFDWLVCTMVYYGISLNSANFSADPFLYMFLAGLMELPSYTLTIPFVVKFGRKAPLVAFFVLCALGTLVLMVLPGGRDTWWFLAVVMASKFCITSAYQVIYLYCSELYPTCLRTRGLGITSMVGRTGAIISPFITDMLGVYHWAIPSTIFGSLSLVAALLTCLLPETNNRPLPDTIADVEAFSVSHASNRGQIPRPSAASTGEGEDEEPCISPTSATSSV